jgi:hypothetical protein
LRGTISPWVIVRYHTGPGSLAVAGPLQIYLLSDPTDEAFVAAVAEGLRAQSWRVFHRADLLPGDEIRVAEEKARTRALRPGRIPSGVTMWPR